MGCLNHDSEVMQLRLMDNLQLCPQLWVGWDEEKVTGQGTGGTSMWNGSRRVNIGGLTVVLYKVCLPV